MAIVGSKEGEIVLSLSRSSRPVAMVGRKEGREDVVSPCIGPAGWTGSQAEN